MSLGVKTPVVSSRMPTYWQCLSLKLMMLAYRFDTCLLVSILLEKQIHVTIMTNSAMQPERICGQKRVIGSKLR